MTVTEWLKHCKQSDRARRHLWDLIAIATLNESPDIAAAGPFVEVLRQAFFSGPQDSQLAFAKVGLSDLYVHAARLYIESRGGKVLLKSPVERLQMMGNRVEGVQLRDGTILKADWVVSAVPATSLLKILPRSVLDKEPAFQHLRQLKASPIISIHIWFDRSISRRAFVGMLDTHLQWFFNKPKIFTGIKTREGYISVVISGAHTFIDWPDTALLAMALEELRRLFPRAREALLLRSLVIKEHQATLSPTVGCEELRPLYQSPVDHLLLCGDWTKTGLPATIESACVSGHACAEIIFNAVSGVVERPREIAHA
jgi:squalene-associated FAD-dependent desaturase